MGPIGGNDVLHIENAGSVNVAGDRFIDALRTYEVRRDHEKCPDWNHADNAVQGSGGSK